MISQDPFLETKNSFNMIIIGAGIAIIAARLMIKPINGASSNLETSASNLPIISDLSPGSLNEGVTHSNQHCKGKE